MDVEDGMGGEEFVRGVETWFGMKDGKGDTGGGTADME